MMNYRSKITTFSIPYQLSLKRTTKIMIILE